MGEKDLELKHVSQNHELLLKDKERLEIKYASLKREIKDLNGNLNQVVKKYEAIKSELSALTTKMTSLQAEKENFEDSLQGIL